MSFNNIKTNLRSEKGFTIVELLIVIVVIGILAAITIVSFNGVTNKANTTSAKSSASAVIKKSEAYNAEKGSYPLTLTALTSAAQTESYSLTGVTVQAAAPTSTNGKTTVQFQKCAATAANEAAITASTITGVKVVYWDFSAGAVAELNSGSTAVCFAPSV